MTHLLLFIKIFLLSFYSHIILYIYFAQFTSTCTTTTKQQFKTCAFIFILPQQSYMAHSRQCVMSQQEWLVLLYLMEQVHVPFVCMYIRTRISVSKRKLLIFLFVCCFSMHTFSVLSY